MDNRTFMVARSAPDRHAESLSRCKEFRNWVGVWWVPSTLGGAAILMMDADADEAPVRSWNSRQIYCIAKSGWRYRIKGTHVSAAGYSYTFVPDAAGHSHQCNHNGTWQGWVLRSGIGMDSRLEGRCPPEVAVHEQEVPVACGS